MAVSLDRVWMFDDPRSHGARSVLRWAADGLRLIGKNVHVSYLRPEHDTALQQLRRELIEFGPTAILLANHPAKQFWTQLGFDRAQCDSLVWVFDDPSLMGDEPFSAEEIVLLSDPSFEAPAKTRGAQTTLFVPVAAPDRFHVEEEERFKTPIVYVGSAADVSAMRNALSDDMAEYFDTIAKQQAQFPSMPLKNLLSEHLLSDTKKVTLTGQVAYYIYANANRIYRLNYLQPLANSGLALYGNQNWTPHITNTPLEACFRGEIDPASDYPNLICSVAINLNLRSLQGFSAPTHRDFLVPRLGGFLLSTKPHGQSNQCVHKEDYNLNHFPWSPEIDSPDTITFQSTTWLDNITERRRWIDHAKSIIDREHLFSHRMMQLNDLLQ